MCLVTTMATFNRRFLSIVGIVLWTLVSVEATFRLSLSHTDNAIDYKISLRDNPWLHSAPTFITIKGSRYSTEDGSLQLQTKTSDKGMDKLGLWESTSSFYKTKNQGTNFKTIIKTYPMNPNIMLFGQYFIDGAPGCGMNDSSIVTSSFPAFNVDGDGTLGYLSYGGIMFGDTGKSLGVWTNTSANINSGLDGGPLILFDKNNAVTIISTFSQFMATSVWQDKSTNTVNWGIMGSILDVPRDYESWVIVYTGQQGINKAMADWGSVMRKQYNKPDSFRHSDLTINYLGYWTDNGAYYYYKTEDGKTYEQTLIDVKTYADSQNIPYRYVQYDSWWYPKGPGGGVTEWVSMPSIFPDGMQYLWNQTGWPVSAHNRWWSSKTGYAKQNGGKYNWIVETSKSIPIDQTFWNDLLRESRKWGLITYEQDWLNTEFEHLVATLTDIHLGRMWLMQMGRGAADNGLTIQYCMAPSRHALQSLEIPVVTQARVSGDYHPGKEQWRIGMSSIFADALGIAPFKDNFWTTEKQPGNKYKATEPYHDLNAAVSTLSTGPVGPSDMVGGTNATMLMMCCNSDGLILKPSKPAMAINAQIQEAAFKGGQGPDGEVWTTYSDFGNGVMFGIILAADLSNPYNIGPTEAFGESVRMVSKVYSSAFDMMKTPMQFTDKMSLKLSGCGKKDFCLYYTTPVLHMGPFFKTGGAEVLLLGDLTKWVPMSTQRFSNFNFSENDITLDVRGGAMEKVPFWININGKLVYIECTLSNGGTATLSIASSSCMS